MYVQSVSIRHIDNNLFVCLFVKMKSSQQQLDLSSDRVCGQSGTSIDHLECPICHKLLWKPVACETCETTFCTTCIKQWLIKSPNQCPNRCEPYVERKCPPLTAKLLGQLQVSCSYQPYGCREVVKISLISIDL